MKMLFNNQESRKISKLPMSIKRSEIGRIYQADFS